MSVYINLKRKIRIEQCSNNDEDNIDIIFEIIKETNPRRCIKTNKKTVLVRNYFIFKEHERWHKQFAIMHSFHPWTLIEKAEISIINDFESNSKTIFYRLDIGLIVILITFFAVIFGIFMGTGFYIGNSSILSGIYAGLLTSLFTGAFFSIGLLMQIASHKATLYLCANSIIVKP